MNEQIKKLADQMFSMEEFEYAEEFLNDAFMAKFAELILANHAELTRSTDPINKPFELNPKFVAKCDEIGRSRRQFQ